MRLELLHRTPRSRLARLHASAAFEQAAAKAAVAEGIQVGGPVADGPAIAVPRGAS